MMQSPKSKQGNPRSKSAKPSSFGSHSRFVVVNGLQDVSQISENEIRAIETHFWAELSQLLNPQKSTYATGVGQSNAAHQETEELV